MLNKSTIFLFVSFLTSSVFANVATFMNEKDTAIELTDLQDIIYAGGLVDWENKPVDKLLLDIFYPTGATSDKKYPLIVHCHGGAFIEGDKDNVEAVCDQFADKGFISVPFHYRVGYDQGVGQCGADTVSLEDAIYRGIQDANACLRFLVANAEKYNIDTNWIFLSGQSAGAVLALFKAYLNDSTANIYYPKSAQKLGGLETSGNTLTNSYSIKGINSMWGAIFSDQVVDTSYKAYPTIWFRGELFTGIPDSVGFYKGCENYPIIFGGTAYYDRLRRLNVPAVDHKLALAKHGAYHDFFCVENASCFFNAIMAGKPYSGAYSYYDTSCQ